MKVKEKSLASEYQDYLKDFRKEKSSVSEVDKLVKEFSGKKSPIKKGAKRLDKTLESALKKIGMSKTQSKKIIKKSPRLKLKIRSII